MADLIAIAYDDTTTAEQAMAEVANLQEDLDHPGRRRGGDRA